MSQALCLDTLRKGQQNPKWSTWGPHEIQRFLSNKEGVAVICYADGHTCFKDEVQKQFLQRFGCYL